MIFASLAFVAATLVEVNVVVRTSSRAHISSFSHLSDSLCFHETATKPQTGIERFPHIPKFV